jgi:hypothetical protein
MAEAVATEPGSSDDREVREKEDRKPNIEDSEPKTPDASVPITSHGSSKEKVIEDSSEEKPKSSKSKQIWEKIEIDLPTVIMMFK